MKTLKSILGALTLIALVVGSGPPANASALRAGAKCSKAGLLATSEGKKYVCVKTGKRLTWSKGSPVLTLDTITPKTMRDAAYAEYNQAIVLAKPFSTNIVFAVGPSASKTQALAEVQSLKKAVTFWGDIFQPKKLSAFYVAEGDVEWVDDALCKQANYCSTRYGKWSEVIKSGIAQDACTGGQAILSDDNAPVFIQCIGKHSTDPQNKQTSPHEYTHNVQQLASNIDSSPRWLSEGSAVLFGAYVALHRSSAIPAQLDYFLNYDKNSFLTRQDICDANSKEVSELAKCFSSSDLMRNPLPKEKLGMLNSISFFPGAVASQALVAVFGLKKFKNFTVDLKTTEFATAFKNNFGLPVEDFYKKMGAYFIKYLDS